MKKFVFILFVFLLKGLLILLFSSDFRDQLFIPFISLFVEGNWNPWQTVVNNQLSLEFPYPPLMLYILSFAYAPAVWEYAPRFLFPLFYSLPSLVADGAILWALFQMAPYKRRELTLAYFASPIILYAIYMHGQLDLIPTAFLVLATYFLLSGSGVIAACLLGCALATKFHTLAALPLFVIYALKKGMKREAVALAMIPVAIYIVFSSPFFFSEGYQQLVWNNHKQMGLYSSVLYLDRYGVYLPLFAAMVVTLRFVALRNVTRDLFSIFLTILFAGFLLFLTPSPGWYVWLSPFLALFAARLSARRPEVTTLYGCLCVAYLIFFVGFYTSEYRSLLFMGEPLPILMSERGANIAFTLLEATLLMNLYVLYRYGLKENRSYHREGSLFIGVGGDSGSGKTLFTQDLGALLDRRVTVLEGDGDHRWERGDTEWEKYTHLDPKANHLYRQADNLQSLKLGETILRSEYDHRKGSFTEPKKIASNDYILFCGLHPFYLPKARKLTDLKIYLDPQEELRCHWKVLRDMVERGKSYENVEEQLQCRSEDAKRYIHPQKACADVVVRYFSADSIEPGKTEAVPLQVSLSFNANLPVDPLIKSLRGQGVEVLWDYGDDLEKQTLTLQAPPTDEGVILLAEQLLEPFESFQGLRPKWRSGYRGLLQVLTLWVLFHKQEEAFYAV